jgi:hypothetical protein
MEEAYDREKLLDYEAARQCRIVHNWLAERCHLEGPVKSRNRRKVSRTCVVRGCDSSRTRKAATSRFSMHLQTASCVILVGGFLNSGLTSAATHTVEACTVTGTYVPSSRLLRTAECSPRFRSDFESRADEAGPFERLAPTFFGLVCKASAQQQERRQPTAAQNAVAGAIAGFTARMAVAPVDLAKIRLQVQQGRLSPTSNLKYRGMIGTMLTVAKEEGFLALWKGNIPAQLMVMTFVAIKFSGFNACRNVIEKVAQWPSLSPDAESTRSTAINFLAGGMAGALATTGAPACHQRFGVSGVHFGA